MVAAWSLSNNLVEVAKIVAHSQPVSQTGKNRCSIYRQFFDDRPTLDYNISSV